MRVVAHGRRFASINAKRILLKVHAVVAHPVGVGHTNVQRLVFRRLPIVDGIHAVVPAGTVFLRVLTYGVGTKRRGPVCDFILKTWTKPLVQGSLKGEGMLGAWGPIKPCFNVIPVASTETLRLLIGSVSTVGELADAVGPIRSWVTPRAVSSVEEVVDVVVFVIEVYPCANSVRTRPRSVDRTVQSLQRAFLEHDVNHTRRTVWIVLRRWIGHHFYFLDAVPRQGRQKRAQILSGEARRTPVDHDAYCARTTKGDVPLNIKFNGRDVF